MTTFTAGKPSPSKNDTKNASLAVKSRQQVINEANKRRTLLQDNSWIKKRPEEENTDENYGRVVLNQYKSQDGLHRTTDENDDQKALLSQYRSDTTLDRVSGNTDADKANKLPGLDSRASKSKETDISANTGNVTSPVKKKRQSWMPPPVSNPKADADNADQHKRLSAFVQLLAIFALEVKLKGKDLSLSTDEQQAQMTEVQGNQTQDSPEKVPTTSDKSGGPKMTIYSSEPSPKSKAVGNDHPITRQICPAKPSESDANSLRTVTMERTQSQDLDNLIKAKDTSDKSDQRRQDLDNLIKVKATRDKSEQEGRNLDDLITVNNTAPKNRRSQEVNDLIEIKPSAVDQNKNRSQELDNLIEVKSPAVDQNKKRSQELDNLIEIKPSLADQNKNRNQELDNLIKVKSSSADQNKKRQELDDLIEVKSTAVDQNKKWAPEQDFESANIPGYQSEKDHSHQVARGSSYNASSSYSLPKNTIVYTRTYENSRIPHDAYEDNLSRKSIKTVYSTSDRAVIEKEMCTYCRKPLGTDTKMILDALQICCHATCFKCEVCKGPLEELKAGDSIWIYKNTVHCSPCYSDVKASWVH